MIQVICVAKWTCLNMGSVGILSYLILTLPNNIKYQLINPLALGMW